MRVFARLAEMLERHDAAALVTVIATRGSTPREAGTRLVVAPEGTFSGTIGGGRLEYEALAEAGAAAATGRDRFFLHRFALGPELGQCCGGAMTVAVEVFSRARSAEVARLAAAEGQGIATEAATAAAEEGLVRRVTGSASGASRARLREDGVLVETFCDPVREVIVFGAGHVGRALMLMIAGLPMFRLTWVDGRPGQFPARLPASVTAVATVDPAAIFARAAPGAFALIMTHDHALDLAILEAALSSDRLGHVGLIGSATKRARFVSRLRASGMDPARAEAFACPIGIDGITSKEPAAIAASVVADLLIRDERAASAGIAEDRGMRAAG